MNTDAADATGGQRAEGPKDGRNGASRSARGYEFREKKESRKAFIGAARGARCRRGLRAW